MLLNYRLKRPTMALVEEGGRQVAKTIPKNAVISVKYVRQAGLVPIIWEGRSAMMFAEDIRSSCTPVDDDQNVKKPPRAKLRLRGYTRSRRKKDKDPDVSE